MRPILLVCLEQFSTVSSSPSPPEFIRSPYSFWGFNRFSVRLGRHRAIVSYRFRRHRLIRPSVAADGHWNWAAPDRQCGKERLHVPRPRIGLYYPRRSPA
jgi:hypothetical protein